MFLVGRINIVKMTILPNAIYGFNVIPIKLPMAFSTELKQKISQCICKHKRPRIAKQSWERRMELEKSNFLTSDYTTKLQSSYRRIEQDRKPRNKKPRTYTYLIFDKGGKTIQWGKDRLFNKWCLENRTATCKRMKLEHFLKPYTKINSN